MTKAGKTNIKFNNGIAHRALVRALRISRYQVGTDSAYMRQLWRALLPQAASAPTKNTALPNELIGQRIPAAPTISESDWDILASAVMSETVQAHAEHPQQNPALIWDSLSEDEKAELNAEAEDYRDVPDCWERTMLSPGARVALRKYLSVRSFHREYIDTELDSLYDNEDRMLSDSAYAKERIRDVLQIVNELLHTSFALDLQPNRPIDSEIQDLHRYWSRLRYQGLSFNKIAAEETKRGAAGHTPKHIRLAIKRYRSRREPIQKIIRELILRSRMGSKLGT